jgi:hypothetical protein
MVAPLKTRGVTEVQSLLRRVTRLHALRRVGEEDFRFIAKRLKEIEARIVEMHEQGVEDPFE